MPVPRAADGAAGTVSGTYMKDHTKTTLAAEADLKQLMADVTRAMEKAQEAVARITKPADDAAETRAPTATAA